MNPVVVGTRRVRLLLELGSRRRPKEAAAAPCRVPEHLARAVSSGRALTRHPPPPAPAQDAGDAGCFKGTFGEFEYKMCPFDAAKQGYTSLGDWSARARAAPRRGVPPVSCVPAPRGGAASWAEQRQTRSGAPCRDAACRGAWARVTIDRFRHSSPSTFFKKNALLSADPGSRREGYERNPAKEGGGWLFKFTVRAAPHQREREIYRVGPAFGPTSGLY
jgi:hypothetical protein